MLSPDTVLQNRYQIIRLLAQGGMGAVYEARDQRLGHTVALKETFFSDEGMRQAFHREASLLASLRHQSLPKVTDHFTEGDGQFLVMEYIRGDDLAKLLDMRGRPMPEQDVLVWADQLLGALEYLHAQQPPIIHRDIKPQNLKLNERGEVILLDFGLAKGAASQQVSGAGLSVRGYTLSYAPIEQIQGQGTEARSDEYSAAATLYHLLTGVEPPDAVTRAAAVVNGQPDPLRPANEINPQVSPQVATALQQALAQDRNQRFASAAVFRSALRHAAGRSDPPVAAQVGTQHQPPGYETVRTPLDPITQPRTHAPVAAAPAIQLQPPKSKTRGLLLGAGVVVVLLGAIAAYWFSQRPVGAGIVTPNGGAATTKPVSLKTREILGRGDAEVRSYAFTAGPGEIKVTLDLIAGGSNLSVEMLDGENNKLNFEGQGATLSLGSSGHHEQATARLLLDREVPLVMKISNSYPKDVNAYRVRLDGAVKLPPQSSSDAASPLASLFADRDQPKPLVANPIFGGQGTTRDVYYGFTAGPGEIKLTLNVIAGGSATSVEFFGTESERLQFADNSAIFSVSSSGHNEQGSNRLVLDRRQPVVMRLSNSYPKDLRAYRLRFEGPVEVAQDSSGDAAKVAQALAPVFADRDQPQPLKTKELTGRGSENDLYYTFSAGPGVVKVLLNVEGNGSGISLEVFDQAAKKILFENNAPSFLVSSSGKPEEKSSSFTLDREQPVVMRVVYTYPKDLKNYRLQLDGPVKPVP